MSDLLERPALTDLDVPGDEGMAHIIRQHEPPAPDGTVLALCGYRFRQSRDPAGLPVCPTCRFVHDAGLHETDVWT